MSTARRAPSPLLVQIITCGKTSDRRLDTALRALGTLDRDLDIAIVSGFVADDPIVDTLYDGRLNGRYAKRPISRTEIAVYASHRLAWSKLLESGHAGALVLEDDFGLRDPDKLVRIIDRRSAVLGEGRDIVKLFDFEKRGSNRPAFKRQIGCIDLVKWRAPTAGMVAYLISRSGAEKLLVRERIFRQVDEDTKYFWELGLDIWSVPGNPIGEIAGALGGSVVDAERKSMKSRNLAQSLWGNWITADRKARTRYHLLREARRRR